MGVHQEAELQAGEEVGRRWLITPTVALSGEVEVVERRAFVGLAAIVVAVGLTGLAVFQVALIAGAPLGRAAWGGTSTYLPKSLRIASAVTIVIYALGALLVLRRAGFSIRWISPGFARWGTWAFVIILTLAALVNFLSQSPWERFLLAPTAVLLATLSLIVAIKGTDTVNTS
jgi:hypothetical protein